MKDKLSKLINVYKKYGLKKFFIKLYSYIKANYFDKISFSVFFRKAHFKKLIKNILEENTYDRIILWRSSFGYNVELFQRPQHISKNLANQNCLVLYEVSSMTDKIKTVKKQFDNLYLFNFNNVLLNKILMKELSKCNKPKYIQLYSTDWKLSVENIKNYINFGFKFIYEYIDDLSPEIAGTEELPQNIKDKYEESMKDTKNTAVIVTADEIEKDVLKKRDNYAFSCNGVTYEHFKVKK